ncbi:hypothetical protein ACFWWB_12395 [Streptomyces sp. NPDC058690]|uniref:hypothetical protein n=1 Tax=Streptomyces sp. NPDC058690 TaxID=3346600 RepID=UPI0036640B1B
MSVRAYEVEVNITVPVRGSYSAVADGTITDFSFECHLETVDFPLMGAILHSLKISDSRISSGVSDS